jgi:hypothetical protein
MDIIFLEMEKLGIQTKNDVVIEVEDNKYNNKYKLLNETVISYSEEDLYKYLETLNELLIGTKRLLIFDILSREYGFYLQISDRAGIYIDSKDNQSHRKIINHLHKLYIEHLYRIEIID